ncbi:hypothetical protein GIB67_003602 [Kingdonia uniflora]|uniref:Uncharacterized protein n=1 Tax=Kingdonia uniflora TaxID=39325 RepID=A0A7J7MF23_9MAGN|nr:hypothetical protein GIB67_003602 [Kingdonia uniflora]
MEEEEEEIELVLVQLGSYTTPIQLVRDSSEEILLLWSIQQPTHFKQNALVHQSSLRLDLEACGRSLTIFQSPSSMSTPGVTGAVMWDSGVILAKFLEHSVDSGTLLLQSKKLINKNVEANVRDGYSRGAVTVSELVWGDDVESDLIEPPPDYGWEEVPLHPNATEMVHIPYELADGLYGSSRTLRKAPSIDLSRFRYWCSRTEQESIWDVPVEALGPLGQRRNAKCGSEGAVADLLLTLLQLCGTQTTIMLTGELRNDAVLEHFLDLAMKDFVVGRVDQEHWHPEYHSSRVMMLVLVKKSVKIGTED